MATFNLGRAIKHNFWLSVFFLLSLLVLIILGTWQIERLEWKNALIDKVTARLSEAPIKTNTEINLENDEFRKTTITGRFLHDKEIHLGAKYHNGKIGFQILTPFVLSNNAGTVLVNRGWVPLDLKEKRKRGDALVKYEKSLSGIIYHPQRRGLFTPDNDAEKNYWFWLDMEKIEQFTKLKLLPFIIVEQGETEKNKFPIKLEVKPDFKNDHLQYAITWFSLAIVLLVVYISYLLKNPGKK